MTFSLFLHSFFSLYFSRIQVILLIYRLITRIDFVFRLEVRISFDYCVYGYEVNIDFGCFVLGLFWRIAVFGELIVVFIRVLIFIFTNSRFIG